MLEPTVDILFYLLVSHEHLSFSTEHKIFFYSSDLIISIVQSLS